ncbi:MAG: Mut7-C RNAse domain-containing protein [Candidatus Heimdallarchaeota archaeon]
MKFIVDRMYNRIARWLRMLGYDTILNEDFVDQDYIQLAKKDNRILITRDEDLKRRAEKLGIRIVTLDAPTIEERLIKLHKEVGLELAFSESTLSRCSVCNSEIRKIEMDEILDKISELTQLHYNEFWICKNAECDHIYWKGSHWTKMEETLNDCNEMIKLDNEKQNKN